MKNIKRLITPYQIFHSKIDKIDIVELLVTCIFNKIYLNIYTGFKTTEHLKQN